MNYRLLWHKTASKFLEKCSPKQKEMVKEKLELLQSNPYKHPQLDIKIMQGYDDVYRLRIGQYRLIYRVHEGELVIFMMTMGNRGDVYKHFQ
jgi:mRNA interferase RelE/StbE